MERKLILDTARNLKIAQKGFIEAVALEKIEKAHTGATQEIVDNLQLNIDALKYTEWDDVLKAKTVNNLETLTEHFEKAVPTIDLDKRKGASLIVKKLKKNLRKLMEIEDESI